MARCLHSLRRSSRAPAIQRVVPLTGGRQSQLLAELPRAAGVRAVHDVERADVRILIDLASRSPRTPTPTVNVAAGSRQSIVSEAPLASTGAIWFGTSHWPSWGSAVVGVAEEIRAVAAEARTRARPSGGGVDETQLLVRRQLAVDRELAWTLSSTSTVIGRRRQSSCARPASRSAPPVIGVQQRVLLESVASLRAAGNADGRTLTQVETRLRHRCRSGRSAHRSHRRWSPARR